MNGYSLAVLRVSRNSSAGTDSGVDCWSASWSVLRRGLRGGGDCGAGASVSVDGAMLECLVLMYASSDASPSPVSVMLSGVVLVILTVLLGAMCLSCCSSGWSKYFVLSSINMLPIWKLEL